MAVKTTEEILGALRTRVGDQADDETISFLEDISDTLSDLESRANDDTNWRTKYEENDREWRKRYTERFFSSDPEPEPDPTPTTEPEKPKKFEDLFKVKEN